MLQINTGTHTGPPGTTAIPEMHRDVVRRAIRIITNDIVPRHSCSNFARLPGGRTLAQMIALPIWLNYDPTATGQLYGWVEPATHPHDVALGRFALRLGVWSVAGTIVHELAHLNGAPGGNSHDAERALRDCGLRSPNGPYDPSIRG